MSWQAYINEQLLGSGKIQHAVICGHDGVVRAQSSNFTVNADEVKELVEKYKSIEELATRGITIGGIKYMYLSSDNAIGVVRGKKGTSGIHCMRTKQTYIIAIYDHPIKHEEVASVIEALGEYLVGHGY